MSLCIFATIKIKQEHYKEAKTVLQAQVERTVTEDRCIGFRLLESKECDNTLHLFEEFEDEEALNWHLDQDYSKEIFQKYETWLAEPISVIKLNPVN